MLKAEPMPGQTVSQTELNTLGRRHAKPDRPRRHAVARDPLQHQSRPDHGGGTGHQGSGRGRLAAGLERPAAELRLLQVPGQRLQGLEPVRGGAEQIALRPADEGAAVGEGQGHRLMGAVRRKARAAGQDRAAEAAGAAGLQPAESGAAARLQVPRHPQGHRDRLLRRRQRLSGRPRQRDRYLLLPVRPEPGREGQPQRHHRRPGLGQGRHRPADRPADRDPQLQERRRRRVHQHLGQPRPAGDRRRHEGRRQQPAQRPAQRDRG